MKLEIKLDEADLIVIIGLVKMTADQETREESLYLQQLATEIQVQIMDQKTEPPPASDSSSSNNKTKKKTPFKEFMTKNTQDTQKGVTASKTLNKRRH